MGGEEAVRSGRQQDTPCKASGVALDSALREMGSLGRNREGMKSEGCLWLCAFFKLEDNRFTVLLSALQRRESAVSMYTHAFPLEPLPSIPPSGCSVENTGGREEEHRNQKGTVTKTIKPTPMAIPHCIHWNPVRFCNLPKVLSRY